MYTLAKIIRPILINLKNYISTALKGHHNKRIFQLSMSYVSKKLLMRLDNVDFCIYLQNNILSNLINNTLTSIIFLKQYLY